MGTLQRLRWRRRGYRSGRPEDLWRDLIAKYATGRSFADVGCMWRVHGAYAFHAAAHGATAVTGIDVQAATPEFAARNATAGGRVRFVQGDLNDTDLGRWAGRHDVVFCSGVLYHVPNPIYSIFQLRRLCAERLILTSATIMDDGVPNAAVFLPTLDDATRARLNYQVRPDAGKIGLDRPIDRNRGYAPWFWLPTPSCLRAMVVAAGFEVVEFHKYRRVTTIVATPTGEPLLPPL